MDFENFFPSIRAGDVRNLLLGNLANPAFSGLDTDDVNAIVRIVCRGDALTIGAPSSPAISNAMLYQFDTVIAEKCAEMNVTYTRYADDIAFSSNEADVLSVVHNFVQATLSAQISPRLTVNHGKTVFTSRKHLRSVTGLVLTSTAQVSIGRKQKRRIKALCFKFGQGELSLGEASYLRGYLSYINSVEPNFVGSLRQKYGSEFLDKILDLVPVKRKL
jgi:RNA-directed DNA polymerase